MTLLGMNVGETDLDRRLNFLFKLYCLYADKYNLPRVIKLTSKRRRELSSTMSYSKADLRLFVREFKQAIPFFQKSAWFNFDWLIQESNYIKVMEGKYRGMYQKDSYSPSVPSAIHYEHREF